MALVFGNISLPWIVGYDENAEVHSEAFVLYDGTTKYAPSDNSGRTMTFTGVEKGTGFIADVRGEIGNIATVQYENMSNASMTIIDFSYSFKAYDGTDFYYDWSISFGEAQ